MRAKLHRHLTYANVMATIAVFIALGGAAYAAATIGSADVIDNSLRSIDVRNDSSTGGGLAGSDIKEDTLGTVPSALSATLGGKGRSAAPDGSCDPTDATFVTCTTVTFGLPARSRVLLLGSIEMIPEPRTGSAFGAECRFGSASHGPLSDPQLINQGAVGDDPELTTMAWVVGPFPRGPQTLGIDCNESDDTDEGANFRQANITAVALSDD